MKAGDLIAPRSGGWLVRVKSKDQIIDPTSNGITYNYDYQNTHLKVNPDYLFGQMVLLSNGSLGTIYDIKYLAGGTYRYRIKDTFELVYSNHIVCKWCGGV